jgi:serine-type D-Ala-D-Ala carboxypeptidase (penicillin-binding protein 5/6)
MEPLHRVSLIPQLPPPHFSAWKKMLRYTHISGFIIGAFFLGIGFAEGVISFASKGSQLVHNVVYSEPVVYTTIVATSTEQKGSDEKGMILPVSLYNVKGKPAYINGDAYLVGDVDTGEIILAKESEEVYPIASVSKLTTALVAIDHFTSKQEVTVTKSALATYGPSGGLRVGEKVKALDLLYPLLLESSNDVAQLISEQFEIGEFAKLMNQKVQSLEMTKTSYEEASGLSAKNVSTAGDLFKLAQYIYSEAPNLLDITRIREFSLMNHTWNNYNFFLKDKMFIGGKNGYTDEALRTGVELFEIPIKKGTTTENHTIAIIVLHTDTREQDITRLLDFLKKSVTLSQ